MPKTTKAKKKVTKQKTKVTSKPITKVVSKQKIAATKAPIKISKNYIPKDTEKYMCEKHRVFFRIKLNEWIDRTLNVWLLNNYLYLHFLLLKGLIH